jgi:acetyl esterase/lipase
MIWPLAHEERPMLTSGNAKARGRLTGLAAGSRQLGVVVLAVVALATAACAAERSPRVPPAQDGAWTPVADAGALRLPAPPGVSAQKIGEDERGVYIFTLERLSGSAPVVLFLHGGCGTDPYLYAGWIDHIVRNGSVVIFPVFAKSGCDTRTPVDTVERNIVEGTQAAIALLQREGQVQPDANRFAIIGHSFGGGLSAQIASKAQQFGLPVPRFVMPVMPGWRNNKDYPIQNVANIPSSVYLLVVEGDKDQFEGTRYGLQIFRTARQIPLRQRAYVQLHSRQHDGRNFLADHFAPLSPDPRYRYEKKRNRPLMNLLMSMADVREGETDDLDVDGFWRLFDNTSGSAFRPGCDMNCSLQRAGGRGAIDWTVDESDKQ